MIQVRILTPVPDADFYRGRWTTARIVRGTRGALVTDGVESAVGGTNFEVAAGTVETGGIVRYQGQHFRVEAFEPVPPFRVRDRLYTSQAQGQFLEDLARGIAADGNTVLADGSRVVAV